MAFEYLEQYKTFESVAEMDQHVEQHIQQHYFDLTESERAIVFALSQRSLMYPGASHLKAETIAESVEVSTKTVYRAVKKLVELNIIEKVPGTKLNGIKGASIYRLLPYVPSEMSERVNEVEVNNDAVCHPQIEDQSFNSFNLFKTSEINDVYNNAIAEKEAVKEYMNEYQVMLYDFMHSLPLANEFKDELHKLVLAAQVNSVEGFVKAKNVMINLAKDIADGTLTITRTLRSVFVGAFNKTTKRSSNETANTSSVEEQPQNECPAPFYDWLNEREENRGPDWLHW